MSRYRNDDTAPDPPETALAVSVVTGSSSRRNLKEDVNLTVQVEHEFRARTSARRPAACRWACCRGTTASPTDLGRHDHPSRWVGGRGRNGRDARSRCGTTTATGTDPSNDSISAATAADSS